MLTENLTQQPSETAVPLRRGERRKQHTKRRLLDAAAETYAVSSVEAATISAITERADVGLGTFYLHFEDKDAIACAVSQVATRRLLAEEASALEAVRSVGGDPDPLALFARVLCGRAADTPGLVSALLRWEGPARPKPGSDEAAVSFRALLIPELGARYEAGLARGLYRTEDVNLAADAMLGVYMAAIPHWVGTGRTDWNTLTSFLERTVLSMYRR